MKNVDSKQSEGFAIIASEISETLTKMPSDFDSQKDLVNFHSQYLPDLKDLAGEFINQPQK